MGTRPSTRTAENVFVVLAVVSMVRNVGKQHLPLFLPPGCGGHGLLLAQERDFTVKRLVKHSVVSFYLCYPLLRSRGQSLLPLVYT